MALDPSEFEIGELGPKLAEIEDLEDLQDILEAEKSGENRKNVITLVQSRIDKLSEEPDDHSDIDPNELTVAELGNAIQKLDDIDTLESILAAEKEGKDRSSAKNLIQRRIDSVDEDTEREEIEYIPPEEKYPELDHPTEDKQYVKALDDGEYRDMWVYCETQQGALIDVSREMLGKARELMDTYNDDYDADESVVGVLIGGEGMAELTEEVIACGADYVIVYEDERLERFRHKPYTEVFADMARSEYSWKSYDEPRYVLFPATNNGRDLSALAQAELDSGLASDCSGLYIEDTVISNPVKTGRPGEKKTFERVLHMKRPDFSGFEYSTILCLDNPHRDFHPQGASVIPGAFDIPDPDFEREGVVERHEIELDPDWLIVDVPEYDILDAGVDITGHDVIVAVGRGIGKDPTRGIELALDLVNAFDDAELGLTRGVVTASYQVDGHVEQYITEERQIGETGVVVEPQLYIAAGISGAIQHKVGMDGSETIVTINTSPDERIRDFSDYYITGDLFEVLPKLTEAVKSGELDIQAIASDGGIDK